jgi:predicted ArsR family transcriptional regulator
LTYRTPKYRTKQDAILAYATGQAVDGGVTSSEVADHLGWKPRTVSAHMHNLWKMGSLVRVGVQGVAPCPAYIYVRADEAHLYG